MSETSTSSLEESIRAARLQYLDQVNNRLTATMSSADRFVNFAGIIAAATITAGILGNRPLIVILAPYALVIVFAYQVQLYTDAERFTVLLEHLEAQLNGNFYEGIFSTARVLDRRYRNRWSVKGMQVFYALIATASFILSATKAYMKYGLGWLCADVLGMVIGLAFLGIAVNELRHAQQSVLKNLASSPGFELDASVAPPPDQTPA